MISTQIRGITMPENKVSRRNSPFEQGIEDKETEEYIKGMLKLIEPILAQDWDSEADDYWDNVGGIKLYETDIKKS
jgi:deoxyadenosine/deoxycytidine kinase